MSMNNYMADYASRKAGDAVGGALAGIRERTQDKLGAGTFWRILLLAVLVGSLFAPSDFANGMAAYTLAFIGPAAWWLTGNIVVRIKHKAIPEFWRTREHAQGVWALFGLCLIAVGVKVLFPGPYVLSVVISAVFAVAFIIMGARAALAGVAEAKAEIAREERLVLLIATCLGIRGNVFLERWNDGDVDVEDAYDGGIVVKLPEEFWNTLTDEAKVSASFASFAPEYELGDIELSQGTLVLHPVSAETHARRENLRLNDGVTSEEVTFDFGDAAETVKRVEYGSSDDSEHIDFGS
jgi:hypothetical protein